MIKKIISLILTLSLLCSTAVIFSACSGVGSKDFPLTIGDVTIKSEPKNIVVLNDNFADIVSYIGYDVKMVGKGYGCDQEFLKIVPSVGTADNPSIDTITSYETDLVIADETLSQKSRDKLSEAGVTVVSFSNAETMDDLKTLYSNLGTVIGGKVTGKEKGEEAYDDLINTLSSFKKTVSGVVKTQAYLYIDERGALCTFPKGSMAAQFFSYTGALNTFSNQEDELVVTEQLKMGTPTYIFYDDEKVLEYLRNDEALSKLTALSSGRTYQVPLKNFSRQGTTIFDTVYNMINVMFVQSEATPDEETEAETEEVTEPQTEAETEAQDTDSDDDSSAEQFDESEEYLDTDE